MLVHKPKKLTKDKMAEPVLNKFYNREQVQQIFSPGQKFTPGSGVWGISGLISLPQSGSFVFFVTIGQSQAHHKFFEGITFQGELFWQSQPHQSFENKTIKALIKHNDSKSNIHLFLRKHKKDNYKYLGRLKFLAHGTSEKPVHFKWKLLDFSLLDNKETEDKPKTRIYKKLKETKKKIREAISLRSAIFSALKNINRWASIDEIYREVIKIRPTSSRSGTRARLQEFSKSHGEQRLGMGKKSWYIGPPDLFISSTAAGLEKGYWKLNNNKDVANYSSETQEADKL